LARTATPARQEVTVPTSPTQTLPLGTPLPPFRLVDTATGRAVDATDAARGKAGLLVAFICNHCPYVQHIRRELVRLAHAALDRGFAVLAVNANDEVAYPQDGPAAMKALAQGEGWRFPFLFDETQEVARAFGAACTPDLFLFDGQLRLAYRGQFDDSRPSLPSPVTGADLAAAIEAVAAGAAPLGDQRPSVGCSIKWKAGRAPASAG
jgi:peroxiredoxin